MQNFDGSSVLLSVGPVKRRVEESSELGVPFDGRSYERKLLKQVDVVEEIVRKLLGSFRMPLEDFFQIG